MPSSENVRQRRYQTRDWWYKQIQAYSESGLSKSAFCRQNGIKLNSFYNWYAKLKQPASMSSTPVSFVPLTPDLPQAHHKTYDVDLVFGEFTLRLRSFESPEAVVPWINTLRGSLC